MNLAAIILDLDGLLIDTESVAQRAWYGAAKELGFTLPEHVYANMIGRPVVTCRALIDSILPANVTIDQYMDCSEFLYFDQMERNGVQLMDGAAQLLDWIQQTGLGSAIATSSEKAAATKKITQAGIAGMVPLLASADDVIHGKPAPDIFVLAAKLLGVAPEQCVVLEDSEAGVIGANHAGAQSIMVPSTIQASSTATQLAYAVVDSLHEALVVIQELYGR